MRKFRVGQIVYVAFSADETVMEFAFPKEEREALVAAEPGRFLMPRQSDLRYNWVGVRLDAISGAEARGTRPRRLAHGRAEEGRRRLPRVTATTGHVTGRYKSWLPGRGGLCLY